MLVDVAYYDYPLGDMIAALNGNPTGVVRLDKGVYEIGHFSFEHMLLYPLTPKQTYPALADGFNPYGVCDGYLQVVDKCSELTKQGRKFVLSVTLVEKKNQSEEGGWRWHKWGPYIGDKTPTCEYLYDEPDIEKVYVYHIYEVE